jgi:hypothetical protein
MPEEQMGVEMGCALIDDHGVALAVADLVQQPMDQPPEHGL